MSSIFTPELTAALVAHNRLYDVKEFAKAADALLAEGLALLRAHAGEGDVINRYVATVEKVRAQYRAAKEAPAPPPSNKCKGGRGKCGTHVEGPVVWGYELEGLWFCSQECRTNHIKATNPPPSDPVTVATGGVPTGYRLGAGWVVDRTYLCSCTGCRHTSTEYYKPRSCGKGACAAHAVRMGALVPIDTPRPIPPVPAHPATGTTCTRCGQVIQSVLLAFPPVATVDGWRHKRCPEVPPGPVPPPNCDDTGTATDRGGEVSTGDVLAAVSRANIAIKAAVAAANNRAADAFHAYHFHDPSFDAMDAADFEAWLRSGEDAPGAVGK